MSYEIKDQRSQYPEINFRLVRQLSHGYFRCFPGFTLPDQEKLARMRSQVKFKITVGKSYPIFAVNLKNI